MVFQSAPIPSVYQQLPACMLVHFDDAPLELKKSCCKKYKKKGKRPCKSCPKH